MKPKKGAADNHNINLNMMRTIMDKEKRLRHHLCSPRMQSGGIERVPARIDNTV